MIKNGSVVTLHYTGTLTDGTIFDSSKGKEPLVVTIGEGKLIPGFEKHLHNLNVGDKKTFTVPKEEAYPYHPDLVQALPRSAAPAGMELKEGMTLALRAPEGQIVPARITKLTETEITLDLNTPVAGKDLTFAIEIIRVEEKMKKDNVKKEKTEK